MGTDIFSRQVDAAEALQALPGHSHTLWPPDSTGSNQENVNLGRAPWGPPAHPVAFLYLTLWPALRSHLSYDHAPPKPSLRLSLVPRFVLSFSPTLARLDP